MIETIQVYRKFFTPEMCENLLAEIRQSVGDSPFYRPVMWNGASFRFQITSLGKLGWHSDQQGYRYQDIHPQTGKPWGAIPPAIAQTAIDLATKAGYPEFRPESCLVLHYQDYEKNGKIQQTKLGLHRDLTEENLEAPIISLSFGDTAIFTQGGLSRTDPTHPILLFSGDVMVTSGNARQAYHGVQKIIPNSSNLIPGGGRINLTIRQVNY